MSDANDPAFPTHGYDYGMTLRDYFAAKAMQAMFSGYLPTHERTGELYGIVAREAFALADAMLKARTK
jgi:hypothetical protein